MHLHLHFSWTPSRARSAARMGVLALLITLLIVMLVGEKPKAQAKRTEPRRRPTSSHRKHTGKAGAKLDAMQARFADTDRRIRDHFAAMREEAMAEARQVESELAEMDSLFGMKVIEAHAQIVD